MLKPLPVHQSAVDEASVFANGTFLAFVSAVPAFVRIGAFVDQFAPTTVNADVHALNVDASDEKTVVESVTVGGEGGGNKKGGFKGQAKDVADAFLLVALMLDGCNTIALFVMPLSCEKIIVPDIPFQGA